MHNSKNRTVTARIHRHKEAAASRKAAAALLLCSGLSIGCIQAQAGNTIDVNVYFDGNCPKWLDKPTIEMDSKHGKNIQWVAVDLEGTPLTDMEFDIYFDPFVGPGPKSKKGTVTSPVLKKDIPLNVSYKYTILGKGCAEGLDPFIRVR